MKKKARPRPARTAGARPLSDRIARVAALIQARAGAGPQLGVILGSGLGGFADRLERAVAIPYADLPGFPVSGVAGHAGRLVVGTLASAGRAVRVALLQGRVHGYEGWSAAEVAFPARVLCVLGVKGLLVTNAAGGIHPDFGPGTLVRITDQLNLTGQNPLTGPNDEALGRRFPDMGSAYDPGLGALLEAAAAEAGVPLRSGVYAGVAGPSYETPAEIRMLRALGADLVGMSTVHEVIAARHQGVPVAGLSVVTNRAAGLSTATLTHEDVQAAAGRAAAALEAVLASFLPRAAR
jgi:purine-nucleoside phosphorylase